MKTWVLSITMIVSLVLLISFTPVFAIQSSQNNMPDTSKVDPKVLKVLKRANSVGGNFHTLVDVMLESQSYMSDMPKDIELVYTKNNVVGVAADRDQIMNLAGLDFVKQVTAPKGVFDENANVSIANPPTPLKQYKAGIMPKYVICKYGFDLLVIQRSGSNGTYSFPTCFNWKDGLKAQERGIGKIIDNVERPPYWNLLGILPHTKVFFMEPNSTGLVSVKYFLHDSEFRGLANQKPQVFADGIPLSTSDVTIFSEPTVISVPDGQNTTTVTYVIKTSNTSGLYSIYIPQGGVCPGSVPLAVGMNTSEISSADIATYWGVMHCIEVPFSSKIMQMSGIIVQRLASEPYFQ